MRNRECRQRCCAIFGALFSACLGARAGGADSAPPRTLGSAVVYCTYPSIASPTGDFAGITRQLQRLKDLGVTVLWLMPVTPIGEPHQGHPAFGSPYCVHDYYGVNPRYGSPADLKGLVANAHRLQMRVILDEVLNHTAWDNALLTEHPEFYVHSDANISNPSTIVRAFAYNDVAQLDYGNHAVWGYMNQMLGHWMNDYHVDGFRFDSADNPGGPNRRIPAAFWRQIGASLRQRDPNVLLLGECETPELAEKPFSLDYGWHVFDALKRASSGGDAAEVVAEWKWQNETFPPGMLHLSLQDDWDTPRDIANFGGTAGAMAAATFNFTSNGVPLLYNGMEIGNAAEAVNPHAPIVWGSVNPTFPPFYSQLSALRAGNPALQQGQMRWLTNSTPQQALTYTRTGGGSEFVIEINLSDMPASGRVDSLEGSRWKSVPLAGAPAAMSPVDPRQYALPPKGFAIFRRTVEVANQASLPAATLASGPRIEQANAPAGN